MSSFDKEGLYFIALGGAEEVGYNMYVYAADGKLIVVDCGYGFFNDDFPGMELGFASPEALEGEIDNIEGLFITHSHEDHFGAVAHIWPKLKCPIYATPFAAAHIVSRLKDYKLEKEPQINVVNDGETVKLQNFEVKFASLVPSTLENSALLIKTRYGNVVHATDWRFDDGSCGMLPFDYQSFKDFAAEGIEAFVCDSTNLLDTEEQPTEMQVRESLMKLVPTFKNKLVATCFASNVVRLESLILAAHAAGRTPVVAGMSLNQNLKMAKDCGYLQNLPPYVNAKDAAEIPNDEIIYICAGSQGNYRSGLTRIVNRENKDMILCPGDAVIFSSKIIPGNEKKIERMQEKLRDQGVEVISKEEYLVHCSGHGGKKETRQMYEILKPNVLITVHGERRVIREHSRFAKSCGISHVVMPRNGDVLLLNGDKIETVGEVPTDILGVDRNQITSINSQLVKNRKRIAYNGSVFITAVLNENWQPEYLDISSIDILDEETWTKLAEEIRADMLKAIPEEAIKLNRRESAVKEYISAKIRKRIYNQTGIKPVVFMHFHKKETEA